MVRYFKNNKGSFYTLVAILCIANLVVGFEFVKKISKSDTMAAYNNEVKREENNDLYLEVLASSNSYMEKVLNEKYETEGIKSIVSNNLKNRLLFLNPRLYLKSQLPATFSLMASEEIRPVSNTIKEKKTSEKKKDISIEEHKEDYKDKEVESTKDLISSEKPNSIKLDDKNPYIMIYHTHATECYAPLKHNNYHIDKREKNVISVGEVIGGALKDKGHKVKHIEKYHDLPSFNKSYTESLKTVKEELNNNENLKVILDVHRDGVDEGSKFINKAQADSRIDINGKSTATFKMVVGPDNPNKDQLLKFSRYIRDKSNELYPGLCKGIIVKPYGKFNQYVSDHYTLLEIGSNLNTLDEAKETGKLVGEILDQVIMDLKEEK